MGSLLPGGFLLARQHSEEKYCGERKNLRDINQMYTLGSQFSRSSAAVAQQLF